MAVSDILKYFKENEGKFPQETLIENLRKSGYPEGEIEEALKILRSSPSVEVGRSEETRVSTAPEIHGGQMVPTVWKKIGAWFLGFSAAGIIFAILLLVYGITSFLGFYRFFGYGYNSFYTSLFIVILVLGAIFIGAILALFFLTRKRFWYFAVGVLSAGLAAIVIAGVVSAITYQSLQKARGLSRDARRVSDVKQLQLALELYWDSSQAYPQSLDEIQPKFIPQIPRDPVTGKEYFYEKREAGYYMRAELENASNYALQYDVNPGNMSYEVKEGQVITKPAVAPQTYNPFSQLFKPSAKIWIEGDLLMRSEIKNDNGGLLYWQFLDSKGAQLTEASARQVNRHQPLSDNWHFVRLRLFVTDQYETISNELSNPEVYGTTTVLSPVQTSPVPPTALVKSIQVPVGKSWAYLWVENEALVRSEIQNDIGAGVTWVFYDVDGKQLLARNAVNEYKINPVRYPFLKNWKTVRLRTLYSGEYISNIVTNPVETASLKLIAPNGGEALCLGKTHNIQWQHNDLLRVKLTISDGQAVQTIGTYPADFNETGEKGKGFLQWKVGEIQSPFGTATLKEGYAYIMTLSGEAESGNPFSTKSDSSDKTLAIIKCEG